MDRSNNGAYSRTQNVPGGRALEGRSSVESQRLQKKRSNPGIRNASQPLPSGPRYGQPGGVSGQGGQRKGSLRNVVRKIFGRRSKDLEPTVPQRSPPRHERFISEPPHLAATIEEPDLSPRQAEQIPHRTLSVPLNQLPSPSLGRVRSPYAVEFPQSARLRPIQLPNPFYAPGSSLRRRKTLPSVLIAGDDAKDVAAAIESGGEDQALPSIEISRETPTPDFGASTRELKSAKRRSRSANDLKGATVEGSPPRKRSDEIKYWRDSIQASSFQTNVLRASGFVSKAAQERSAAEEPSGQRTPQARIADLFDTRQSRSTTLRSSPPGAHHGPSFSEVSGYGTELSRDLEDRVAKLEAGLQNFQRSLSRLTAERNRSTVMVGGVPQRRSSTDLRTPSMLADTLSDPLAMAMLRYAGDEAERPATSPQPPRTPVRSPSVRSPSVRNRPPVPQLPNQYGIGEAISTPSPQAQPANLAASLQPGASSSHTPQYTFRSLYEMLSDERSARRRLETQMRGLRQEIHDLQYQVSVGSHVQSQRSSFVPLADPMVGSNRLRDLLRDTEHSPPGTSHSQQQRSQRASGMTVQTDMSSSSQAAMTSRFSNSESEAGAAMESAEDLQTPYEAYQTPREERSNYPFSGNGNGRNRESGDSEMF